MPDFGPKPAWADKKGAFGDNGVTYAVGVAEIDLTSPGCGKPNLIIGAAENRGRSVVVSGRASDTVRPS